LLAPIRAAGATSDWPAGGATQQRSRIARKIAVEASIMVWRNVIPQPPIAFTDLGRNVWIPFVGRLLRQFRTEDRVN